ncbi:MAG: response regulator transcription factor [Rhodospirillales bacterium]|nr:response regulator transcription factor [Rhodospirillales bacterium]
MRVLLAEDDAMLADGLVRSLRQTGYMVDWTADGEEAEAILRVQEFDLVILDLTLPNMDGLEVLRILRARKILVPILIITARSEVEDRIKGLDLGADDYLTKPFELGEFDARVRALLRRSHADGLESLSCGALSLDISARRAYLNAEPLDLPRREFHLLEALMSKQGRIISKDQIIDSISDFDDELTPSTVEIYIHRLRKKLESTNVSIRTVRGVGYILE